MLEVQPKAPACSKTPIGQVMLKRLLSAEQVIERLCEENVFQPHWHEHPNQTDHQPNLDPSVNQAEGNAEPAIAHSRVTALNSAATSTAQLPLNAT